VCGSRPPASRIRRAFTNIIRGPQSTGRPGVAKQTLQPRRSSVGSSRSTFSRPSRGRRRPRESARNAARAGFRLPDRARARARVRVQARADAGVVYAGLLERRRRAYHGAIGDRLEDMHGDALEEGVECWAYHYGRSAEAEKAVDYSIRAGRGRHSAGGRAPRRWALRGAMSVWTRYGRHAAHRVRRIDSVVKQAEIKFRRGRMPEHIARVEAIRGLVDETMTRHDGPRGIAGRASP